MAYFTKEQYTRHLESIYWHQVRLIVIERYDNICQGCFCDLDHKVKDIHHRHYYHFGREQECNGCCCTLLCRQCHEDIHNKMDSVFKPAVSVKPTLYFTQWKQQFEQALKKL